MSKKILCSIEWKLKGQEWPTWRDYDNWQEAKEEINNRKKEGYEVTLVLHDIEGYPIEGIGEKADIIKVTKI